MPTILKTKNSVTTTVVPTTLQQGELAVNITDKKIWVGNAATTPILLVGGGSDGAFANLSYTGTLTGSTGVIAIGTNQIYKDASGNVGIGTSSPVANRKLTISNTGQVAAMRINAPTGYDSFIELTENNSVTANEYWQINKTTSTHALQFWNGAERMRIDSSGRVIVGYTASVGTAYQTNMQVKGSSASNYAGYGLITSNNESAGLYGVYSNGENSLWISSDPDNLRAGSRIVFSVDGTDVASVNTAGNFAINSGYGSATTVYGCRAWVRFTGSTGAIIGSAGVSSITRRATGRYTVNLSFTMPDTNYDIVAMAMNQSYGNGTRSIVGEGNPVTTSFEIFQMQFNGAAEDSNACVAVFR